MTISRSYTYIGETPEGYQVAEGAYTFETADEYSQTTRITLTFATMARVIGILGVIGSALSGNLGLPVVPASIATNVVTLMALESGAASAGLAEKTDAEAYGSGGTIRLAVYGL